MPHRTEGHPPSYSKAILAAAHGHHHGLAPLTSDEFSGGENDAVKYLRRLGFVVPPTREPTWTRDELILACDLVLENGWKGMGASDPRVQDGAFAVWNVVTTLSGNDISARSGRQSADSSSLVPSNSALQSA